MTYLGTRPILQDELQKYELHHRARIAIKPGITGMWQVSGRSDITDFEEVVRLDSILVYVEVKHLVDIKRVFSISLKKWVAGIVMFLCVKVSNEIWNTSDNDRDCG